MRTWGNKKVYIAAGIIAAIVIIAVAAVVMLGRGQDKLTERDETGQPDGLPVAQDTPGPAVDSETAPQDKVAPTTDYEYIINSNEITITKYIGNETETIIPSEIDGRKVAFIGDEAFYECAGLTSVTIPKGVAYIGRFAFGGCLGLTSVTIPNSVTSIDSYAFWGCSGLTSVTIPNTVTSIGSYAFWGCSGLTDVTIPDGVTSINEFTFAHCSELLSITIPNSVISIGEGTFAHTSLRNVTLPNNIAIGNGAFYGTPWSETEDYANRTGLLAADGNIERVSTEIDYYEYAPFNKNNKVVKADFTPSLSFTDNYPKLDGATAFYPIYSALTETVYKNLDENSAWDYVACSTTIWAYERLINGDEDIIFCLEPSQTQLAEATSKGVKFNLTPISKEAFVFFVNADNPINNLTTEQIQDIYSKKITNWKELGGNDEEIMPFQRTEGSGSQTIMQSFMQGKALAEPLTEERMIVMGDILAGVAEYRNYGNAIGYSFRFYATVMNPNAQIKLLSINGIKPTAENIANDTYPLIYDIYAVTTEETSKKENVKLLIDWLLSDEGQRLIELCGYTRIK